MFPQVFRLFSLHRPFRHALAFALLGVALATAVPAWPAVRIVELLAENDGGLADADGETPDWIELFNDGVAPVSLAGWHLTDNPTNLAKWTFPATNLPSAGLLVIFASGKDRAVAGAELHTSFRLEQSGGWVALVRPDGTTIEHAVSYPSQRVNVSYGIGRQATTTTLLSTGIAARVFVPSNGALGLSWIAPGFDPSGWASSNTPVGFAVGGTLSTVLSVDFNERAQDPAATTQAGFQSFIINSNITATTTNTLVVTQATARVFGGITVTASNTAPLGYDDRLRLTPANSGAFTESLLLRDFIFSTDSAGNGGLDIRITGLAASRAHRLTCWSFDSGSAGARVSDWYGNGVLAVNNYTFDGSSLPTSNTQYRFILDAISDGSGSILLSGRRDASSSGLGVFLNAFQVAELTTLPASSGLAGLMLSNSASAYVRVPFNLASVSGISSLTLRVRYNDGLVAYLNGAQVAARNAPASPAWSSTATAPHSAVIAEDIAFIPPPGLLVAGANLLALHGLNVSATDADFTLAPELYAQQVIELTNRYFQPPTPGTNNGGGYVGLVDDTKFSVNRGFYTASFPLVITNGTPGATIYYTTNGGPPSPTNGYVYSSAIPITRLSLIRAAAFKTNHVPSDIDTHTFLFLRDVLRQSNNVPNYPTTWQGSYPADYDIDPNIVNHVTYGPLLSNDLRSIPVLSIVTEHDGLWGPSRGIYNHATSTHDLDAGQDWERAASVELFTVNGTNNHTEFAVNCAIRMHGNASRDNARTPKHNIRLLFDSSHGPSKLRYDWFPGAVDEFDNIILRADGFVDAWPSRYSDATPYLDAVTGLSWLGTRYRPETGTYLRDVFAKESHRAMGWTGSRGTWVHLYLNGLYWGLYNPIERIDSSFMAHHLGGWESDWDVILGPDIGSVAEAADGNKNDWNTLMSLLAGGVSSDAAYQAVSALVDVDNVIDYFILHFFIEAEDWPHHNWYAAHRRANSTNGLPATKWHIFTWDQEVSIDRNIRRDRTAVNNPDTPAYIYSQLRANAEFRRQFGDRVHKHLFNDGALTSSNNIARFAALAAAITNAINGESARWGDAREFSVGGSPATGVTFTRNEWWVPELQKLWTNFFPTFNAININRFRAASLYPALGAPVFSQFGGAVSNGFALVITHTNAGGTIYFTTDLSDPRTYGSGMVAGTATAYSTPVVINTPTLVRARVLSGGNWSALTEAVFFPPQDVSKLALTEIMYNPPSVGLTNGDDFEFIELKNTGTNTLNLSGLTFSGVNFTFTNGTLLAPGDFLVLVRDSIAFSSKYPGVPIHGGFSGSLNNAGETLTLSHALGATIFSVTYDDDPPWPATADNFGFSLVAKNPGASQAPDQGSDWRASTNPGGSPGADDPAPTIPAIVISEVLTHSDPAPPTDTIELFNPTANPVNVVGWFLSDDRTLPQKYRIPDGTMMIPAGGYVSFNEAHFNTTPGTNGSFSLSSHGESVFLFSGGANTNLTGYSHGFGFGAAPSGVSFGRYVNSVGEESWPAQTVRTFNAANAGPVAGPIVFSEIHYHPAPGGDEFIELQSVVITNVPLFDPTRPTNIWRLSGLGFDFPTNLTFAPNSLMLLVGTNPATFRAKYSVPTNVPILGPWTGSLQDSGERLKLERPDVPDTNGMGWIVVEELRYNDKSPWSPAADGSGLSLQRISANAYADDPINWTAAGPTPGQSLAAADTDGDGMPDLWEQASGTQPFVADANDDPDGDGATNLQEYLAGTNPNDAASYLKVDAISYANGVVALEFFAVSNRTYSVLARDALGGGSWQPFHVVPASPVSAVVTVTNIAPGASRFYRLVTP